MHKKLDKVELGRYTVIGLLNRLRDYRGDVSMPVTPNHHNKKLTIHDIAEMAHVSAGTVSRVLNNQPGVGAQTRANIQAIIQEQGYRASFFARNLLARQSFAIGAWFFLAKHQSYLPIQFFQNCLERLVILLPMPDIP
jgi:hypothetical protein